MRDAPTVSSSTIPATEIAEGANLKREEFKDKTKEAAWERCGGHCEKCGRLLLTGDIHYDHDIPCECGGDASLDNCRVLCRSCHGTKTSKQDIPAIAKGRRIRRR